MPRYEFLCKHCEDRFIVSISIVDRDKVKCPKCGGGSVKQIFSPINIGKGNSSGGDTGCGSCDKRSFG